MTTGATPDAPLTPLERFRRVIILSQHCAANFGYFRAGRSLKDEKTLPQHRDIKARVVNNFLDVGVMDWCKLFIEGERHAWQRIVPTEEQTEFQTGLLRAVAMTAKEWHYYVRGMKLYRDKFLAHLDNGRTMNVPVLDPAIDALVFYIECLRDNNANAKSLDVQDYDVRGLFESCQSAGRSFLGTLTKSSGSA